MEPAQLTVTRWDDDDHKIAAEFLRQADGRWSAVDDAGGTSFTLEQLLAVAPDEALRIELSGAITAADVAAALPRDPDHVGYAAEYETGDNDIDRYVSDGGTPVVIAGQRWAAFSISRNGTEAVTWYRCDEERLDYEQAVPETRRMIAYASGIEWDSRTSGTSSWTVEEVDDDTVLFTNDPDDEPNQSDLVARNGRSDRQIVELFIDGIDWSPAAMAAVEALENGGTFDGTASELDSDLSETCEVHAKVYVKTEN